MGDDIVIRLRCNPCDCDGTCYTCQAADEIKRLRRGRRDTSESGACETRTEARQ